MYFLPLFIQTTNLHSSIFKNDIYSFPDTDCICGDTIIRRLYMVSGSMKFTFHPKKQEMIIECEKYEGWGNMCTVKIREVLITRLRKGSDWRGVVSSWKKSLDQWDKQDLLRWKYQCSRQREEQNKNKDSKGSSVWPGCRRGRGRMDRGCKQFQSF